jgi:hypothetical protein
MEVAMTRTAIRHTLSAFAALALALVLIGQSAAGERTPALHPSQLQWAPAIHAPEVKPKTPKGLATQKGPTAQSAPYVQPNALLGVIVQP